MPRASGEWVNSQSSQFWVTCCIQEPICEATMPSHSRRKSRWCSAPSRVRPRAGAASGTAGGGGLAGDSVLIPARYQTGDGRATPVLAPGCAPEGDARSPGVQSTLGAQDAAGAAVGAASPARARVHAGTLRSSAGGTVAAGAHDDAAALRHLGLGGSVVGQPGDDLQLAAPGVLEIQADGAEARVPVEHAVVPQLDAFAAQVRLPLLELGQAAAA